MPQKYSGLPKSTRYEQPCWPQAAALLDWIFSSSASNTSMPFRRTGARVLAVGGLARIQKRRSFPLDHQRTPSVQPLMTASGGKLVGSPRITELSNIFPSGRPAGVVNRDLV